jgi:hypothetical protein
MYFHPARSSTGSVLLSGAPHPTPEKGDPKGWHDRSCGRVSIPKNVIRLFFLNGGCSLLDATNGPPMHHRAENDVLKFH